MGEIANNLYGREIIQWHMNRRGFTREDWFNIETEYCIDIMEDAFESANFPFFVDLLEEACICCNYKSPLHGDWADVILEAFMHYYTSLHDIVNGPAYERRAQIRLIARRLEDNIDLGSSCVYIVPRMWFT